MAVLAAEGQQLVVKTQNSTLLAISADVWHFLKGARERTKKKSQRKGSNEIALHLHLFPQYIFTFRAVSQQERNYIASTVMEKINH